VAAAASPFEFGSGNDKSVASKISAIEAISPAFERTTQLLFKPFHWALWARLAVVGLVTGEVGGLSTASSGIPNPNLPNFPKSGDEQWMPAAHLFSDFSWEQVQQNLFWIVPLGLIVLALVLLWVYSACIYRFMLLDAVLTGECRLVDGWRKWRQAGREYFLWVLVLGFTALFLLGIVAGIPLLLAWRAGWLQHVEDHVAGLLGWIFLLGLLVVVLIGLFALIDLFSRDFLIPVMALENVDALDGWRRLLEIMRLDKLPYVGYVLMRIVLAVGSAIAFAVVNILIFLILLIPLGILGGGGFLLGQAMGVDWSNISVILLLAGFGLLLFAAILYVIAFVYSPGLVFFQSYALEFFASRFPPLATKMFRPAPAGPARPPLAPPSGTASPIPPIVPGDAFPT
jgi:hypothetical protein